MSERNPHSFLFDFNNSLISSTEKDFLSKLKNDLLILKYKNEKESKMSLYTSNVPSYFKYCRGLIIDKNTLNIVNIPPQKSLNFLNFSNIVNEWKHVIVEEFIDGTMINLFYYDGWKISTRSKIGANCKYYSNKTFSELFNEAKGEISFDNFNQEYCYSFVLAHPDNRIVKKYDEPSIYLVQVRKPNSLNIKENLLHNFENLYEDIDYYVEYERLKKFDINFNIPKRFQFDSLEAILKSLSNMDYEEQGYIFKYNKIRSKLRNEKYSYVKNIRGNNIKLLYNYLNLKKNKNIKEYLTYYPEYDECFNNYYQRIFKMIKKLHQYYIYIHINKQKNLEVPFELRPLIYQLHGFYKMGKTSGNEIKITIDYVKNYFNSLPIKKIIFVLNYQDNKEYHESKNK